MPELVFEAVAGSLSFWPGRMTDERFSPLAFASAPGVQWYLRAILVRLSPARTMWTEGAAFASLDVPDCNCQSCCLRLSICRSCSEQRARSVSSSVAAEAPGTANRIGSMAESRIVFMTRRVFSKSPANFKINLTFLNKMAPRGIRSRKNPGSVRRQSHFGWRGVLRRTIRRGRDTSCPRFSR